MIAGIMASVVGDGGGGGPYWTAADAGPINPVSSPVTTYLTLTVPAVDQVAGQRYIVCWQATISPAASNSVAEAYLRIDGVSDSYVRYQARTNQSGGYTGEDSTGGFAYFDAAGTPADVVIDIRLVRPAGTCTVRDLKITVFPANAFAAQVTGTTSVTNTTAASKCSLTVPSGNDGQYLLLASWKEQAGTANFRYLLSYITGGGVTTDEIRCNTSDRNANVRAMLVTVSGATTFDVMARTNDGGAASSMYDIRLIAIPLAQFTDYAIAQLGAANSGAETSYTSALSQTDTYSGPLVTIICGMRNGSNSTYDNFVKVTDDATTTETHNRPLASHYLPFFYHDARVASGSITQSIERKTGNASGNAVVAKGSSIVSLVL